MSPNEDPILHSVSTEETTLYFNVGKLTRLEIIIDCLLSSKVAYLYGIFKGF